MRTLLDTHAIAWWAEGNDALPASIHGVINSQSNDVFISAVSAFEMAQKHRVGKWPGVEHLLDALAALMEDNFVPLPLTFEQARLAGELPAEHRDPWDRMLAAQALLEDMTVVSADKAFDQFGVRRLW